jgi:hypothetical protein
MQRDDPSQAASPRPMVWVHQGTYAVVTPAPGPATPALASE